MLSWAVQPAAFEPWTTYVVARLGLTTGLIQLVQEIFSAGLHNHVVISAEPVTFIWYELPTGKVIALSVICIEGIGNTLTKTDAVSLKQFFVSVPITV